MKIFACKVLFLAAAAGFMSTVLSHLCVTTSVVREAVVPEPTPGLLALRSGRYSLAPGLACSSESSEPSTISMLLTSDKIWIGLSSGDDSLHPEQPFLEERQWKLRNTNGEYDWEAAGTALRESRATLTENQCAYNADDALSRALLRQPAPQIFSDREELALRRESGLLGLFANCPPTVEIAAEGDVSYDTILTAMDMVVAAEFTELAYVDASHLSARFRE